MARQVGIGVVGTGMIANVIADAINEAESTRLVAVSSRRLETAREFSQQHGAERAYGSWREMMGSEHVDAIYVATPTSAREEICVAAAENKKHVLADKPFASLSSLERITVACSASGVAFMDATHFVHHPRTVQIKRDLQPSIGTPRAVNTAFFFPSEDPANIRFDPRLEPTGAIGDMAWYSMRAVVEFLPAAGNLERVEARIQRSPERGAVIRGAGLLVFEDGTTSTWDAGYDVGACVMDLDILGSQGVISLDDFVLDRSKGFAFDNPHHRVGYTLHADMATPAESQFIETPSAKAQHVLMMEVFAHLVAHPDDEVLQEASIRSSQRTQALLDAVWAAANR